MTARSLCNKPATALLIILILGGLLRLSLLGSKSLWFDEAFSVNLARRTPEKIWLPNEVRPETHPPLYYHGLHYWMSWFGDSEFAIRLPSALISLINVALIYVLVRRLFNHRTGIVAAALLALSPLNLWYAQEARMYVFMTAILLLSAILLTWDSWWAVLPLTAVFSIGLYLDYTMLPIWSLLSAIWVVMWWQRGRSNRPLLIWVISSVSAWLLFTPWIAIFYDVLETFSTVHLFIHLNQSFGLPILAPDQYLLVMIAGTLCLVPILAVLSALQRHESSRRWIFTIVLVGFTLATLLFPIPRLFGIKRVLVQVWPLMIVWVSWILDHMGNWRRRLTWGLLAISLMATLVTLIVVPKDDWRGAVNFINQTKVGGDSALLDPLYNAVVANYYDLDLPLVNVGSDSFQEQTPAEIWHIAERFPGQDPPSSPTELLLDRNMELIETVPFYRLEVRRYRAREQ